MIFTMDLTSFFEYMNRVILGGKCKNPCGTTKMYVLDLFEVICYQFYHGIHQSPCFTTIWGICVLHTCVLLFPSIC